MVQKGNDVQQNFCCILRVFAMIYNQFFQYTVVLAFVERFSVIVLLVWVLRGIRTGPDSACVSTCARCAACLLVCLSSDCYTNEPNLNEVYSPAQPFPALPFHQLILLEIVAENRRCLAVAKAQQIRNADVQQHFFHVDIRRNFL